MFPFKMLLYIFAISWLAPSALDGAIDYIFAPSRTPLLEAPRKSQRQSQTYTVLKAGIKSFEEQRDGIFAAMLNPVRNQLSEAAGDAIAWVAVRAGTTIAVLGIGWWVAGQVFRGQ